MQVPFMLDSILPQTVQDYSINLQLWHHARNRETVNDLVSRSNSFSEWSSQRFSWSKIHISIEPEMVCLYTASDGILQYIPLFHLVRWPSLPNRVTLNGSLIQITRMKKMFQEIYIFTTLTICCVLSQPQVYCKVWIHQWLLKHLLRYFVTSSKIDQHNPNKFVVLQLTRSYSFS